MREASQQAAIAQEQAEKKRESDQTQIAADQAVEASHIAKQKAIREQEIEKEDRKSVVQGKSVDLGGRRIIKKKKNT